MNRDAPQTPEGSPIMIRSKDAPDSPKGSIVSLEKDTPSPSDGLPRQNSKVRFDGTDDEGASSDSSNDDPFTGTSLPKLAVEQHGQKNINIRRSSLHAQSQHSLQGSQKEIHLASPRKRVSAAFGSMDYQAVESQSFVKEQMYMNPRVVKRMSMMRWLINFAIGLYVAVIAVTVWLLIKYISQGKFMALYMIMDQCTGFGCTLGGLVVWILFNVFFTFIGAYLVTFHAPSAAGSGIPQVKCYLNGIRMPGLMSLRTLLAKAGGVVLSVCGGLACGKEGPMIHSGSICASGLASGHFALGKKSCDPSCCNGLRSDEERRDFVAAGAASGVSAAFASPVGGVLFALEEGASFVKQELTWRMLFSSMIAGLSLNILMSAIKGHPGDMSSPGLVSFGYLGDIEFKTFEIPIFLVMGVFGGLLGALFVQLNYHITLFRRKKVKKAWLKVGEACLVAACSAILLYALIFAVPNCAPIEHHGEGHDDTSAPSVDYVDAEHPPENSILSAPVPAHDVHRRSADGGAAPAHDDGHSSGNVTEDPSIYGWHGHGFVFRGLCPYGEHNRMADILFTTPEGGLHAMLHGGLDQWSIGTLLTLVVFYHLLTTWTYGLNVSSGLFIPSLLIGALWGRVIGILVMTYLPSAGTNVAKYVLIGAAAQLAGFVRMTISLTVIIIECTGDITFGLPIIITLIMAKWMGDFFNPGIYDLHIEIWGAPLLGWEAPSKTVGVPAMEVMSTPVHVLRLKETVGRIKELVEDEGSHNGFPVVDDYDIDDNQSDTFGRLKGFILKQQLKRILEERMEDLDDEDEISLDEKISLKEHMDISPYSVQEDVSLTRIYTMFRSIGLRHLMVVNDRNLVVGIITRLNVARFRGEMTKGKFHIEELEVVNE